MRVLRFHLYFQLSTPLTSPQVELEGKETTKTRVMYFPAGLYFTAMTSILSWVFSGYFIFYVAIISYKGEFKIHQNYIEASQDYLFLIKCKLLGRLSASGS